MAIVDLLNDIGDLFFGNKRIDELKHFAQAKSFQLRKRVDLKRIHPSLKEMKWMNYSNSPTVKGYLFKTNAETKSLDQIFDIYTKGEFKTSPTTIFLFQHDNLDLTKFTISPKGSFSKIGNIFSSSEWSNVNKSFDKAFSVEGNDLNFLRMHLTFQFAEEMLKISEYTLEGNGNFISIYSPNKKTDIIDMDNIHAVGEEILDILLH